MIGGLSAIVWKIKTRKQVQFYKIQISIAIK
jgi:hypothetical protein